MGLKSHPKVLLCEDLKSLFQSSLMWSLSPSLERVLLTSLESCLTWQLATRGWVIQRKYERSYLFQNSPLQWLNKAHIYIPAILLWQVSLTSRFPAMLACQSYFIILLLIRVDPSWIFCILPHIPCGRNGEVVGSTLFHFLSLLSVFLTGEPNFPVLIH